jgi:hypothetical protein
MITETNLWEVLVPCSMNGHPVRTAHHKEWDKVVRKISGGLTIAAPSKGQWEDPETHTIHEERVIPVKIACDDRDIMKILEFTKNHYNQIAIFANKVSNRVIIYEDNTNPRKG